MQCFKVPVEGVQGESSTSSPALGLGVEERFVYIPAAIPIFRACTTSTFEILVDVGTLSVLAMHKKMQGRKQFLVEI